MAIMVQIGSCGLARIAKSELNANPDAMAQVLARGTARVAKVGALRRMIAAGTYHVSSRDLASKLLQMMQAPRSESGRWTET
jgi:anti-sigma28 factor (negative regulator of flagellin synthesis)